MKPKGTDTIPAMLTPGEYVMQRKAVDFYGPEIMQAINNMKVPKRFFMPGDDMRHGRGGIPETAGDHRETVDLSPTSVQAAAQAGTPIIQIENKTIAQANSASNRRTTTTGVVDGIIGYDLQ